ncbi:uncharacterized protein LOC120349936 [Nilaparvata lugens]|uniref:uncharacterized protein LOC120349936 n=1 Tax=Nilaparvata lugens TaxID=108931 RepID=UPI00193EBCA5|nr:uncharacterized protein LOC120349936 [Nilaparvata lugens]
MTSLPDLRSISMGELDLTTAINLAEQYNLYIPKNADLEFIRSTLRLIKKNFNDLPNYKKERERAIQYILTTVKLSDELKDQFPDLYNLERTLRQNFKLQEAGENSRPSTPSKLVTQTSQTEFIFPKESLELATKRQQLSTSTPNLLSIPFKTPEATNSKIAKQDDQIQSTMAERKRPFFTPQTFSAAPHGNISDFIQNYKRVATADSWDKDDCLTYLPFYLKVSAAQYFKKPAKMTNNESFKDSYSLIISDNRTGKIYHNTNSLNHNYQEAKNLAYKIFLLRKTLPASKSISHNYTGKYQQLSFHNGMTTQLLLIGYFINILYYWITFRTIEGFSEHNDIAKLENKNFKSIKKCLDEIRPLSTMDDKPNAFLLIEEKLAIITKSPPLPPEPPEKLVPIESQCNTVGSALETVGKSKDKQISILMDSGSNACLAKKDLVPEEEIVDNLDVALYAANGKKISFYGNAVVKFSIENIAYEQECYIVSTSVDLLVGNEFFLKNGIDLSNTAPTR